MRKFLERMKEETKSNLKEEVLEIILETEDDYLRGYMEDVVRHGCISGAVGKLIYHKDTHAFFDRHEKEIGEILVELQQETGMSHLELFGDKWDIDDPFVEDTNKNLLAWFAFEDLTARILNDVEQYEVEGDYDEDYEEEAKGYWEDIGQFEDEGDDEE